MKSLQTNDKVKEIMKRVDRKFFCLHEEYCYCDQPSKIIMNQTSKRIDWWEPWVGKEERDLLIKVLDSNFLNDGEGTTQLEEELAHLLGCKHAVAVTSGASALFLALVANNVGLGDEVIVPDITFIATANAVVMAGAKLVLVDINPDSLNFVPKAI